MYRRIQIIVNPAAGQDKPMLATFNSVFGPAEIEWDVSVTKRAGDARRYAEEALASGVDVVGVYGGDGTIAEVAAALTGSPVPMAVFPGGTANALALALGIPSDLAEACALVSGRDSRLRTIDVGQIDPMNFLIAVAVGIPGIVAEEADREEKDRLGVIAYAFQMIQATRQVPAVRYRITVDGQEVETEGVSCIVANSGNFGIRGLSLSPTIDMEDGLLDVLVVRSADLASILSLAASVVRQDETAAPLLHRQGREITVVADPLQAMQADGEVLDPGPVHARILPQALKIFVPKETSPA